MDAVVGQPDADEQHRRTQNVGEVGFGAAAALAGVEDLLAESLLHRPGRGLQGG